MRAAARTLAAAMLAILSGCFGDGSGMSAGVPRALPLIQAQGVHRHISHVVIIIQENRSFEDFFAGYRGANAPMVGCGQPQKTQPAGDPAPVPMAVQCPAGDTRIPLHEITFENGPNLPHIIEAALTDWDDGKMDGFSNFGYGRFRHIAAYAYVDRSQVAPYWSMAREYVLADAMFPTEFGPSWTAHLTLVAGTDNLRDKLALADFADGRNNCDAAPGTKTTTIDGKRMIGHFDGPFPCLDQFNTMARSLDSAGVSWKYYTDQKLKSYIWSPFAAIRYVHDGPDWDNNVIVPQTQVLRDIAHGNLASVSWVTPSHQDSDHPGAHSDTGPSWVSSIVNAIGESAYWKSTAIVVLWDDWGGLYDNAPPPQLDFRGLGIRVPCLIISAYAKRGYVSHTQYEYGSILRFVEEAFPTVKPLGSTSAGYTDTRAASLRDAFDFTAPPRAFKRIKAKYPLSYFLHEKPSSVPVDSE